MSGEDEGEENEQTDDFSSSKDFDFYFPFTKPLVLDLPTEEDRAIASAWVQKLEAEPETEDEKKQRLNYLKLLLFVLQRGRLSGIFKKQPPSGPLQPFPPGFTIFDMGNWMLDQDDAQAYGAGDAGCVPYTIEISNDLREFVASQEIPNFGVQMYYAWSSDDPIHKWSFFDEDKFPQYILDKIKQLQDIKTDETSLMKKRTCSNGKKKGGNVTISDKYCNKKVKSPQEIEKSQGRSFHTYMGLIGRLGNFNDKCDDDPEKFQRQNQKKGKCPRRNCSKRCSGSGGEAEDMPGEEEFDNLVNGLGGLNSMNRPCLCPHPLHRADCSEHRTKGGPQPFEDEQVPDRNCGFDMRCESENSQWTVTVTKAGPRRMRDQCLEGEMSQRMPSQRRSQSPRPRSASRNRPDIECPTEEITDNSEGFPNRNGICICSSPCTCPCPRGTPKTALRKTPSDNFPERTFPDPSRTFLKSPKQDPCGFEDRGFNAPNICSPMPTRPELAGNRTFNMSRQPEVIHCYDSQNPDPTLTKTVEKNPSWIPTMDGSKFMDTDFKLACRRDQLIQAAQQNKRKMSSRRELFSSSPVYNTSCQQSPQGGRMSPPLECHPICDYSPPEEISMPCPGLQNQPGYSNYADCETPANSPQMRTGFHENCGRQKTDTYKKLEPQTVNRFKNTPMSYSSSPSTMNNNNGRLANMTNVLQGIRQKTEAHREKCSPMRSPVRGETGSYHSPQNQDVCSPSNLDRGYYAVTHDQCPKPDSPYPGCYPGRQINFQQDECDPNLEEDDECDSSESQEVCSQETSPNRFPGNDLQSYGQQNINPRDAAEYYDKTLTPDDCDSNFDDDHYCDPQCISPDNSPSNMDKTLTPKFYTMESESQSCGSRGTSPRKGQENRMNIPSKDCGPPKPILSGRTSRDCGTSSRGNSSRSPRTQWISPRRMPECMNQESPQCYVVRKESDRQPCSPQISPSLAGNRYFKESFKARSSQPHEPMTSTPLLHYKRNFQDQGTDDLSCIRPSSNRLEICQGSYKLRSQQYNRVAFNCQLLNLLFNAKVWGVVMALSFQYTLDNERLTYQQRDFYERNGYLLINNIVENYLLDDCIQRWKDICNGKVDKGSMTLMKDISLAKSGARGEYLYNKVQDIVWDEVFSKYIMHPKLLDYVECFTGPDISAMHSMLINKPPDSGKMTSTHPLHQDLYYFSFRPVDRIVAVWTALETINEKNGCLVVVPGSHRGELLKHGYPDWENGVNKAYHGIKDCKDYSTVSLEMEKGETVFFHPLLIHGSGPNLTSRFRKAISCHYSTSNFHHIDLTGTIQESIAEEIVEMAKKKGFEMTFKDIWNYRLRVVRSAATSRL